LDDRKGFRPVKYLTSAIFGDPRGTDIKGLMRGIATLLKVTRSY